MKLIGHLPLTGDRVEVDLLLLPNTILVTLLVLAPRWELAWKFRALWTYWIVNPLGMDIGVLVLIVPIGTLIGTLWWVWNRVSLRATGRI